MDQNKMKCIQCMDKIKRNLDKLGFNNIITNDKMNILCKVNPDDLNNNQNSTKVLATSATSCPHANTSAACPYTACKYPNSACHHHNGIIDSSQNNTSDNSELISGVLEVAVVYESLFRITPNDIDTGIFLHAIKLHGETCDLKMTFGYNDEDVAEIIKVIKFLVE